MPIPFELQPSEQAFFPAPFVPTEQHRLVITNKRLVRFSDAGPFPIGEVPVDTIEFAGRQTERPYVGLAVVMGLLGLLLIIGGLWKVLPPAFSAGKTEAAGKSEVLAQYPNVDGVVAITHGTGCGMDTEGMGMQILERTLAGYATHANFWGVLVVGLGCEANQINAWLAHSSLREGETLKVFNIQDTGGTRKTVEKGIALVKEMLPQANAVKREPCSAAHITIGLQCGGSDGYSGISANPALGAAVDLLVAHGGTAILSETPEIYGAEHLLTRRAVKREVGEKLIARIKWWEHYTKVNEGEMNNNPSPGNKAGGLTTILEKSLGAAAKGGTTTLTAVYEYAERVSERGGCTGPRFHAGLTPAAARRSHSGSPRTPTIPASRR